MKKLITLALGLIILNSCTPAGTIEHVNKGLNDTIEIYRYYYSDGNYVYVSRFKHEPKIVTTTYQEPSGDSEVTRGNVIILDNDSILMIRKK